MMQKADETLINRTTNVQIKPPKQQEVISQVSILGFHFSLFFLFLQIIYKSSCKRWNTKPTKWNQLKKKSSKILLKPLVVLQYKIHRKRDSLLVGFAQIWQHCLGCHMDPPAPGKLLLAPPGCPGEMFHPTFWLLAVTQAARRSLGGQG